MKNIFKSILMVLSGAMLFASCLKEAAPLASEISLDKQEVTFTGYAGSSAQVQKVKVTSNGDWFVTNSADWLTIKPTFGTAGVTNVEITVADNVDSFNELNGPRSTVVNFCYGTTGVAPLTIKQTGETGLDASRTYSLVKNQEEIVAGSYLIVFKNGDKHIAMEPLTASKTYGYLNAVEVTPEDDVITMPNASYAFTLEAVETGYNMIMADNRYIFMTGGYNSFNVSAAVADANPWTFTLNEDGTVQIAAVTYNNYIQYSTGFSSAGAYTSPQDGGLLPYLYKDAKAKSEEVLMVKDVTVPAFATSAKIKVQSNRTWSVRNHDEWIKTFTKNGKGEGVIEVTFDEYTSTTEARTATFQIIGEETNTFITFTQAKVAPAMTVEQFLAEDVAKGDFAILTGSIENIKNSKYGNFDLQDETGKVYVYGIYDVNGDKVFTEYGLKEGDIVTIYGVKDEYNGTLQMKNSVYVSHVSSKIRRKLAFADTAVEATLGNPFTAPVLNGDATDVEFSSSDEDVATVDAATGEVTLLAEGTTTITANGPETETHLAGTASYTLTVSPKLTRNLAFSATTVEAVLGEEFTAPELTGETEGVVYSSSNTDVATVDPETGVVTLVAEGETTITATAEETFTHLADAVSYTLTVVDKSAKVVTIAEFNAAADGDTIYELSGTITGIYQAYSSSYGNISVYLKDATAQTLIFRMDCDGIDNPSAIAAGDKLTVQGKKTTYSNAAQMAQGGKVISYEKFVAQPTEWGVVGDLNTWGATTDVVMYNVWHTENLFVAYNVNIASGAFKIRANNAWNDAKNYGLKVAGNIYANSYYTLLNGSGSQNITPMAYGTYDVYFDLANKRVALMTPGKAYSEAVNGGDPVVVVAGLKDHTWGVIGDFTGNSWTSDYAQMEVEGDWAVAKNIPLKKNQEFKFRADKDWTLSYGTACDVNVGKTYTSHNNGGNMKFIGEEGNYNLYFSLVDAKFYMEKAAASSEPVTIVLSAASRPCSNFPNTSTGVTTKTTYTIGDYEWTFSPSSGNKFSWYSDGYILWGKSGGYILMPAIEGKKLTKVTILTGKSASTNVKVGVYNEAGNAAVSGGTAIQLNKQNAEFSWTLSDTANNTKYQLRVTSSHNAQLQKLTLVYE